MPFKVDLNDLSLEGVPTKNKGRPRSTGEAKIRILPIFLTVYRLTYKFNLS